MSLSRRLIWSVLTLSFILVSCHLRQPQTPEEGIFYAERAIFSAGEYGQESHSSTVIALPGGDLLAAWWSGSYEGASDVVIKASRFRQDSDSWEAAVTIADTLDQFDGNPVLFVLPGGRIWLFFVTMEPDPSRDVQIMFRESNDGGHTWRPIQRFVTRSGIRTRNHPIIMKNGEILFPLHDQILGQSIFLISADRGETWELSEPIASEPENTQPTVIERSNGDVYVLMRTWHEDPAKRFLWQAESQDYGRTWSEPGYSAIPSVNSAIEMVKLRNGHVVLAFNRGRDRERTPLDLALSLDDGRTWPYCRDLESGEGSFSYPSLVETKDGHIHVTYSYHRQLIKHVEVNEAWIKLGMGEGIN